MYTSAYMIKVSGLRRPLTPQQIEAAIRRGLIDHNYKWTAVIATNIGNELDG